ncbi:hypothetical protein ACVRXQ_03195 [Streptococcus panodentis]|uniref:Cingulin n=1 Tax=Streptococcus panodentis TaxID=1581472 RepID=A0ABS5B037_9STRE|nr:MULTISPECIES: hypothetical protein [Streptococcus]KXT77791.1 hypothetical protein STRDD11_02518 [Streptococcus sp. DD11]MBP2622185.1 hypothetical protein [Streptococcus panodentis]
MTLEDDVQLEKELKEIKIKAEEEALVEIDGILKSHKEMLEQARQRQRDFEKLQALLDAFAETFPQNEEFEQKAANFRQKIKNLENTLDNEFEALQQHSYRLDEEKGYLRYQKKKLAEDYD